MSRMLVIGIMLVIVLLNACSEQAKPEANLDPVALKEELLSLSEEDATRLWESLDEKTREAVMDLFAVDEVVEEVTEETPEFDAQAPSGCRNRTRAVTAKNSRGEFLWTYYLRFWFCYDGIRVSDYGSWAWAWLYAPGYRFAGHVDIENTLCGGRPGEGPPCYIARTTGHFTYCAPWEGGACRDSGWATIQHWGNRLGDVDSYGWWDTRRPSWL